MLMANRVLLEAASKHSNVVVSPLSFKALLGFLALGSTGSTRQQLIQFLGTRSGSADDLSFLCKKIASATAPFPEPHSAAATFPGQSCFSPFSSEGPPAALCFSNAVWLHEDFSFKSSFESIIKHVFGAESRVVNHGEQVQEILEQINSWAASVSNGLITEIIPQNPPSMKPVLVLASALYFKGKWAKKFDTFSTQYKNFYLINGGTTRIPFMTRQKKVHLFRQLDDFKVVALAYQNVGSDNREFFMYIFLPNNNNGLPNLIQKLNENPALLTENLLLQEVELSELLVPKFKFSFDFEASRTMKKMELTLPFNMSNQDFNDMVVSHNGYGPRLSKMFHKACIEVDEEGVAEVGGFTAFPATNKTCSFQFTGFPPQHATASFVADHPFFFMIKEESSKLVFFSGAVFDPVVS
ncbi:hypothetical protein L6164_006626 [Bauhinia variegata]|uniref:Uncharacterized protein n=1 Tax=Bauhinia variegata TaxID=167791 RepID=A0ACB9PXQ5_BAUVA|nr:hypothetical protein L6164_006626 [Bauhinia variegata]